METEDRDYLAEMSELIADETAGSGWVAAIVAAKLHARLLESDPDLLDGWLREMAVQMLRQAICDRSRSERATARSRAGSRSFARAAAEAEKTGDIAPLIGMFSTDHTVNAENMRKLAADMTGPDHLFVAENTYQRSANEALMHAAFHRAVAAKVGDRLTSEVYTEAQYEAMYRSIVRSPASAAA